MLSVDAKSIEYVHSVAELVPEGESTQLLLQEAKKHDMYICYGMFEQDPVRHDYIYNTAVLIGPEGYIGKYRKVHQPGTERLCAVPGDDYYVYDTKFGKIGLMICYDKVFPEVARILKLKGADLIICPTAWPAESKDEDAPNLKLYKIANEYNAIVNMVPIIDSNGVSDETPDGVECGHSRIINTRGETLATTYFDEGMAVAELDPIEDINASQWKGLFIPSTNLMKDRKPKTYAGISE